MFKTHVLLSIALISVATATAAHDSKKSFFHTDTFTDVLRSFEVRWAEAKKGDFRAEDYWRQVVASLKAKGTKSSQAERIVRALARGSKSQRRTVFAWFESAEPHDQLFFLDLLSEFNVPYVQLEKQRLQHKKKRAAQQKVEAQARFERERAKRMEKLRAQEAAVAWQKDMQRMQEQERIGRRIRYLVFGE